MTAGADDSGRRVEVLGDGFHTMDPNGVKAVPHHFLHDYPADKRSRVSQAVPAELRGWRVLDSGGNAGVYAREMKRRGADRVVAVDSDARDLGQGRRAAAVTGLAIEWATLPVFDATRLGERFDRVLFMGVFHHPRHPLLAPDLIRDHVAKDLMLFQTMQRGSEIMAPVEAGAVCPARALTSEASGA